MESLFHDCGKDRQSLPKSLLLYSLKIPCKKMIHNKQDLDIGKVLAEISRAKD
jgi:hypothetical protein